MAQQIKKGTVYVDYGTPGISQVTAANLNNHVDNAELLPGCISSQPESTAQASDYFIIERVGVLYKYAMSSIRTLFQSYFVPLSGATMTGELLLSTNTPTVTAAATSKGYVDTAVSGSTLVGAIVMWGGSTIPTGWLECNGQTAPASLQSIYGSTLPDLRGEFIRGWDNGRGVDPGRGLRTTQAQDIQPHQHTLTQYSYLRNFEGGAALAWAGTATANTGLTGGTETRPRNFSLRFIVKT